MRDEEDRAAIVNFGVYDKTVVGNIKLSGKPITFTINMLTAILLLNPKLLLRVIKVIYNYYAGERHKSELEWLWFVVGYFVNPPTPPNGRKPRVPSRQFDDMSWDEIRAHVEAQYGDVTTEYIEHNMWRPIHSPQELFDLYLVIMSTVSNEKRDLSIDLLPHFVADFDQGMGSRFINLITYRETDNVPLKVRLKAPEVVRDNDFEITPSPDQIRNSEPRRQITYRHLPFTAKNYEGYVN